MQYINFKFIIFRDFHKILIIILLVFYFIHGCFYFRHQHQHEITQSVVGGTEKVLNCIQDEKEAKGKVEICLQYYTNNSL